MSVTINLLPWRQIRAERLQQKIVHIVGVGFLVLLGGFISLHFYYKQSLQAQHKGIAYLSQELANITYIATESTKLKKAKTRGLLQAKAFETLIIKQAATAYLLNKLAHIIPTQVFFTKIIKQKKTLTLIGWGQSSADIALFLQNIAQTNFSVNPELHLIRTERERSYFEIKMDSN